MFSHANPLLLFQQPFPTGSFLLTIPKMLQAKIPKMLQAKIPKMLHPKPQMLHPKPQMLHPKPQMVKPERLNFNG